MFKLSCNINRTIVGQRIFIATQVCLTQIYGSSYNGKQQICKHFLNYELFQDLYSVLTHQRRLCQDRVIYEE